MPIVEMEAITETEIEVIGEDFRELSGFILFKNGFELPTKVDFEVFDEIKVRFRFDITGLDAYQIKALFFRDKNGKVRQNNDNQTQTKES